MGAKVADKTVDESMNNRLAILLSMAMFVFVIDTALMNVSISAVIKDIDSTVSGVQAAVALEALVSAAFILIGSKVGDLIGRKRAFTIGIASYSLGALSMTVTQSLLPIIIFWSFIGGLGASLYLPAMQSLIHGNFEGKAQRKAYAIVGASAAIATAVGPLIGGFITTTLSWRVGFLLEAVVIAIVLFNVKLIKDVPFTGKKQIDVGGSILSVVAMGGIVLSILIWQEGGERVAQFLALGIIALDGLAYWLIRRKKQGKPLLLDPDLFKAKVFRIGITQQMMQQIALGGMMIALPIYLQMVFEYNAFQAGLSLAPLSFSMFLVALLAGKKAVNFRPGTVVRTGFLLLTLGTIVLIAAIPRSDSGWNLVVPLLLSGSGLGLLVSQLNNYTLSPIPDKHASEAAGVNSASGSFGLSFGLAFAGAIMLATLAFSFTNLANSSTVLTPDQQQQVASALEEDAEIMTDTQLKKQLSSQTASVQEEIIDINTEARHRALQVALLIPLVAGFIGLLNSFRMIRLPDPKPTGASTILG